MQDVVHMSRHDIGIKRRVPSVVRYLMKLVNELVNVL